MKYSHVIWDDPKVTETKIGLSMSVYVTQRYDADTNERNKEAQVRYYDHVNALLSRGNT